MKLRPLKPLTIFLGSVLGLLVLLVIASFLVDEPLRRTIERRMNSSLTGYEVRLPHARFSLFGLSVTLKDLTIRQKAHPEPPVASLPRLRASVQWSELLQLRLVADLLLDRPKLHIDRRQLMAEARDAVPVKDRGWQEAVEAIYPLKVNLLNVEDADVTYRDGEQRVPLHLGHLDIEASNIRNIRSKEHVYPSPFWARATLLEKGRGELRGHANFLAKPFPGIHALFELSSVPLEPFRTLVERGNVDVKGGTLSTAGELEYAPSARLLDVDRLLIDGVSLEYTHTSASGAAEARAARSVQTAAKKAAREPEVTVKLGRLELRDSTLALRNRAADPDFRVFIDQLDLTLANLSTEFRDGPARATLSGRFLGSGRTTARATFRSTSRGPDVFLKIAIDDTEMVRMNDLLRAYGNFDVVSGKFSYYSELYVKGGAVTGYVKPLFRDLKVYDRRQDAEKTVFRKLYEKVVGGVADLLENSPRDEVATKARVEGRIDDPRTSTWQVILRLIQNAFFRAILPGFDAEVERQSPTSLKRPRSPDRVDLSVPARPARPASRRR